MNYYKLQQKSDVFKSKRVVGVYCNAMKGYSFFLGTILNREKKSKEIKSKD